MATINRTANAVWMGDLAAGSGMISFESGAFKNSPVTWASRTESSDGKTSPEELIAAAHASCFAMAFSHTLSEAGHKPQHLDVAATVSLEPKDGGGFGVTASRLTVRGKVPTLSQDEFADYANQAEQGCPISNALRGNLEITVDATLEV